MARHHHDHNLQHSPHYVISAVDHMRHARTIEIDKSNISLQTIVSSFSSYQRETIIYIIQRTSSHPSHVNSIESSRPSFSISNQEKDAMVLAPLVLSPHQPIHPIIMTTANELEFLEGDILMTLSFDESGTPVPNTTDDSSKLSAIAPGFDRDRSFPCSKSILFETKCIEEHVENGLYNSIANQLLANQHGEALCEAVNNKDFEATLDKNQKNIMFINKNTYTEYKTLLFGEIDDSTIMSTKGNHWCDRNNVTFYCSSHSQYLLLLRI